MFPEDAKEEGFNANILKSCCARIMCKNLKFFEILTHYSKRPGYSKLLYKKIDFNLFYQYHNNQ